MMRKQILSILVILAVLGCAPKYELAYPPYRWLVDNDQKPIAKPKKREESLFWDGGNMQFFYQLERLGNIPERAMSASYHMRLGNKMEALNANNFDEVADSSWFTNRVGRQPMSKTDLARGPNRNNQPNTRQPWTILSAKTQGQTPGFFIKDDDGNLYLVKFDPIGYSELASGAEMISTMLLYAFGYNVPENYVVRFDPKILTISPKAKTKDAFGKKIPFTQRDLDALIKKMEVGEDGKVRALASKLLSGKPLGPIPYLGRRSDDKNDKIPHEHRRELRGYRIFAAFLDHSDSREANSLDMFIKTEGNGTGYVKHYLIDFGNTLGSYGIGPKFRNHLYDYFFSYPRVLTSMVALGFYTPYWQTIEDARFDSIGLFEAKHFHPDRWRPVYPNPGFQNMTDRDAFWAVKILARIPDDAYPAVVTAAQYSNPEAADYVVKTLIERKRRILNFWFTKMNPLDDFVLTTANTVRFTDLAILAQIEKAADVEYSYRIPSSKSKILKDSQITTKTQINIPQELLTSEALEQNLFIEIERLHKSKGRKSATITLIVGKHNGKPHLLGLRREAKPLGKLYHRAHLSTS